MTTKITDLDVYVIPDTDNPDGRLMDDVYTAGTPPVLVTAGSDALCDYPVMDLATLAYKLIRENSDTPSGTPDTQTSSQIYDALINRIKGTAWEHDFSSTDMSYILDEDGAIFYRTSVGALMSTKVSTKGITFLGVGTGVSDARMAYWSIDSATWTSVSSGGSSSASNITLTGFPSNGADMILHASIRFSVGGTSWATTPASVQVADNGSGVFHTTYMYVPVGLSPTIGTSVRLILTFEAENIF